ncbi:MAG TPA: NYN domain-containing protein [Jatrophihabitans sp.]|nr:NYN domain-containing protein [Jatrophihabitans sp.]
MEAADAGEERDTDVSLVEPARAQLLTLAADVLGRLPAEQVPASLRAIARFAPVKRTRLGGVAIAAALDADSAFRQSVAQALADAAPDLAAAVCEGASTAAADPVDVALVAYLLRPDGWQDIVADANRRWSDERDSRSGAVDELERVRGELAEIRARVRSEPARVRDAVAAAVADANRQVGDLQKAIRDRTRELRAAERERDDARADAEQARADAERRLATAEGELRRLRARVADLERGAEAARRDTRAGREIDDARMWLLVETLVQAANGVRRELSLPPPSVRPGDTVQTSTAEPAGRRVADPSALDRLLGLPNVHLIIDGYNVTKSGYGGLSLADQRTRLVTALAPLAAQSGAEITVAFDGAQRPPAAPAAPRGVRVLFSAAGEIADDLIRRLVAAEPSGRPVVVVSSDAEVVADTGREGAWTVASSILLARLG